MARRKGRKRTGPNQEAPSRAAGAKKGIPAGRTEIEARFFPWFDGIANASRRFYTGSLRRRQRQLRTSERVCSQNRFGVPPSGGKARKASDGGTAKLSSQRSEHFLKHTDGRENAGPMERASHEDHEGRASES